MSEDELREALTLWLSENTGSPDGDEWDAWPLHLKRTADALLAGPLAPLLAKVQTVDEVAG